MKVLHVVSEMDPELGGVSKAVRTMAAGLHLHGIKSAVVSLDDPKAGFFSVEDLTVYALGPAKNPWSYSKKLVPWLMANSLKFNAVIIHGLWLYNSHATRIAFSKLQKNKKNILPKLFVMPHGMLDPYFQEAPERKLKALRNKIYWRLIESKVINNANGLLFTCEEEKLLARKTFGSYKPKKELVVGMGVEAPPSFKMSMSKAFNEKCTGLKNRPYLLFISRIHEKKGVDILVKAYAEVLNETVHKDFVSTSSSVDVQKKSSVLPALVIAGPGLNSAYGKSIQEMVKKNNNLSENVFFPGMLEEEAKWGAFYNAEAFILPSHQENFGIAVVEALACGKPVLISDQVNIWREIEACGGGIIGSDTLEGTIHLLQSWVNSSPDERKKISRNAEVCFRKNYSVGSVLKKWKETIGSPDPENKQLKQIVST
ncbi:glycosyltransferase [Salegentibacter sp. F188]|uniref:Glycosyltransferase n=1 Tax=Autumnicola patrickiae TaxID=3075591 RepID=A0ABU3DYP7_9FLAO|nr:glycosyltransferase [Salegentibacter sp. F188]MDT0688830.1 glycosyltransferase [Salegentibacter sp. F188]